MATVAPGNREPLPLLALRAAGVRVGLGQDGIRDYWSPYGNGDMLARSWQLAFRNAFRRDDQVELCVDVASRGGRAIVGATAWSPAAITDDRCHRAGAGRSRRSRCGRRRYGHRRCDGPPTAHARHPRRRSDRQRRRAALNQTNRFSGGRPVRLARRSGRTPPVGPTGSRWATAARRLERPAFRQLLTQSDSLRRSRSTVGGRAPVAGRHGRTSAAVTGRC